MKNDKFYSEFRIHFKRHVGLKDKREPKKITFRLLSTAGEAETTQENIRDWLGLDEEASRFQLLTEK
jgi:hypothetical protein